MKIVYIAPFSFSPKATVSARMLPMATALVRAGHTVHILIPPYDNAGDTNKIWTHEGVCIENMSVADHADSVRGLIDLSQQLAQRAKALQPDIVHVFKPIGVSALVQWQLSGAYAKRIVVDNDDWEGAGGWLDVNPYSLPQKLMSAWQEGWSLRSAGAVTCASHVLVERSTGFRKSAAATLLFPNGPDNSLKSIVTAAQAQREALRQQFGWNKQTIAIYTGTIPHGHDMDMAVRAIASAPACRWVIIASGGGIDSLKASIAQAGIAERVEWHGFMPHAAMVERLVAADVALYPYRDTNINRAKCSGKIIDYMAAGKPIVASAVGMNSAYLENERSALLTAPGDGAAFTAGLQRLLAEPAFAQKLGEAAQQRLWQSFGWDARIGALEALYTQRTEAAKV